jgi:hypothetical protein
MPKAKSKLDRDSDRIDEVFWPGLNLLIAENVEPMTIFYSIVYNTVRTVVPIDGRPARQRDHDRIDAAIWEMVDKLIGKGRKAKAKRVTKINNTNRKESQAQ